MENLLNNDAAKITLDAVLAPNDTLGRAIIEACKADAKYKTKLPVVTGQDAEFDSALSIKNGEQYMTVFKDTAKLSEAAVILADAIANGKTPEVPGAILAEGDLKEIGYTGTGYVPAYLLDPIGITKENVIIPVNAGFYTAEESAKLK
jgi:putative multiple sugar transport system substrate-binding protein